MLAQGRRGRRVPDLALGSDGAGHLADATEVGVLDLEDHLSRADLLVFERLRHRVHGRARHMAPQETQPVGRGLLGEAQLEDGDQLRLVGEALGEAGEAQVLSELGQLHALDQRLPELFLIAKDHDPAVPGRKVLGRHEGLVAGIGNPLRLPIAVERPDREVGEHAHRRVQERDVYVPPCPRTLGVEEPDHEAEHAGIAAREVDDADAALAGRAVGLTRDPHVARVALDEVVEARLARARPRRAEAAQRAADDARVDALELPIGQPELGGQVTPDIVEYRV